MSAGLLWIILSHGVSRTICNWMWPRQKNWWWIWGEPRHWWPVSIQGVNVDIVEDHKYLWVNIDNKLHWAKKMETLYRKGQGHLHWATEVLQHLPNYPQNISLWWPVRSSMLLHAGAAGWGWRMPTYSTKWFESQWCCDSLMVVSERKILTMLWMIWGRHRSNFSARLIPPKCMTEHHRKSFLTVAV